MRKLRKRSHNIPEITQLVSGSTRIMNPGSLVLQLVLLTIKLNCLKLVLALICIIIVIIIIILFLAHTA